MLGRRIYIRILIKICGKRVGEGGNHSLKRANGKIS